MKTIVLLLTSILIGHALISIGNYILDIGQLAVYGKGYLTGKFILLSVSGIAFWCILKRTLSGSTSE
jgi:hypothetical protein